jgi:hypothetical protein
MSEPTYAELKARLEKLEAEALEQAQNKYNLTFKIGNKGTVSVYGLGKFPVSLYFEQWMAVVKNIPKLVDFLNTNKAAIEDRVKNPVVVEEKKA